MKQNSQNSKIMHCSTTNQVAKYIVLKFYKYISKPVFFVLNTNS